MSSARVRCRSVPQHNVCRRTVAAVVTEANLSPRDFVAHPRRLLVSEHGDQTRELWRAQLAGALDIALGLANSIY